MNEAASFCPYPCDNPEQVAIDNNFPPKRGTPPPDPNAPIFTKIGKRSASLEVEEREIVEDIVEVAAREVEEDIIEIAARAPSVNLLEPPYKIANGAGNGAISASTIYVRLSCSFLASTLCLLYGRPTPTIKTASLNTMSITFMAR